MDACEELNEIEAAKDYLKYFIKNCDLTYISRLKNLCTAEEWKTLRSELAEHPKIKNRYTYIQFLIQEKMTQSLFDVCKSDQSRILELFPHLINDFSDEAAEMFKDATVKEAKTLDSRNAYHSLCRTIKQYDKLYGNDKMMQIIDILKINHKPQPAFIDALRKIKK